MTLACAPLMLACSVNGDERRETLDCVAHNGTATLRSWTALGASIVSPAFLSVRTIRTVAENCESNDSVSPRDLENPRDRMGPNVLMPNVNPSVVVLNPAVRDFATNCSQASWS